ncbi:MAG: endonuclease G [Patiriisocius sp.]|jgi:endonuclease G
MYRTVFIILFSIFCDYVFPQTSNSLVELIDDKELLEEKVRKIDEAIEVVKLQVIMEKIKSVGLPSDKFIEHAAMALNYSEEHEQSMWVAHMITPDIMTGGVSRTNDFRVDPKVETGTAIKEDYFIEFFEVDSNIVYDGFGYDRGHLAPSADFRWSYTALSESYFYSNMSPQLPEFNREKWGELENHLRGYIYAHPDNELFVVTLPVLEDDLQVIERGVNKVSIPNFFIKVVMDLKEEKGIAFVMENRLLEYPLIHYAKSIDEVEELSGFDFFNKLELSKQYKIESTFEEAHWFPKFVEGNVKPLYAPSLPKGHFNTLDAKFYAKKKDKIIVCGTVVSSRYSKKKNAMLQLDLKYPNEIFSVFIPKESVINFDYDPVVALKGGCYCFEGTIDNFMGHPSMRVKKGSYVEEYSPNP